jgi:hypothetical protein
VVDAPAVVHLTGRNPMRKAGRTLSKAAESVVEAIGIIGGWNRGRRRSRNRR